MLATQNATDCTVIRRNSDYVHLHSSINLCSTHLRRITASIQKRLQDTDPGQFDRRLGAIVIAASTKYRILARFI